MNYRLVLKSKNTKIYRVLCKGYVAPERTQKRDLTYSVLRRGWDPRFYAMDVDWLEYYEYKPVAILESKLKIVNIVM